MEIDDEIPSLLKKKTSWIKGTSVTIFLRKEEKIDAAKNFKSRWNPAKYLFTYETETDNFPLKLFILYNYLNITNDNNNKKISKPVIWEKLNIHLKARLPGTANIYFIILSTTISK